MSTHRLGSSKKTVPNEKVKSTKLKPMIALPSDLINLPSSLMRVVDSNDKGTVGMASLTAPREPRSSSNKGPMRAGYTTPNQIRSASIGRKNADSQTKQGNKVRRALSSPRPTTNPLLTKPLATKPPTTKTLATTTKSTASATPFKHLAATAACQDDDTKNNDDDEWDEDNEDDDEIKELLLKSNLLFALSALEVERREARRIKEEMNVQLSQLSDQLIKERTALAESEMQFAKINHCSQQQPLVKKNIQRVKSIIKTVEPATQRIEHISSALEMNMNQLKLRNARISHGSTDQAKVKEALCITGNEVASLHNSQTGSELAETFGHLTNIVSKIEKITDDANKISTALPRLQVMAMKDLAIKLNHGHSSE